MEESQQDSKKKMQYEAWNKEQSDELLHLMVEGARHGWRDNSGIFSKQTVDKRILPILNKKLNCNKTYAHYQSRLKWFKARWTSYSNLMKFSSGFGYDATTKRFTASDEVWNAYLAVHSKDTNMRYMDCSDYEDLEIAIGNGVDIGKNSITTDARTLTLDDDKGHRDTRIYDYNFHIGSDMFVPSTQNDQYVLTQVESSPLDSTQVESTPLVYEGSTQRKKTQYKRSRAQFEGNSCSNDAIKEMVDKLSNVFDEVRGLSKKIDTILHKRENERAYTTWDAIKEIPNLDEETRFNAFELINTKFIKDSFLKMTIEERARWIAFKIKK